MRGGTDDVLHTGRVSVRLIITPSNMDYLLVGIDTDTGEVARVRSDQSYHDDAADPTRPPFRPFGITWCDEYLYVANRTCLLVFDSNLDFVDKVRGILDQNTHQIAWHKGKLISTMTRCDCIAFIDPETLDRQYFHPYEGWLQGRPECLDHDSERYHINSVVAKGDLVYMLLSNRGRRQSEVAVLDMRTGLTEWIAPTATLRAHGIYVGPEGLGTLDTGGQHDLWMSGERVNLYTSNVSFCRGLAGNNVELACGHFNKQSRRFRGEGGSAIKIVRQGQVDESHHVQNIGAINDMRLVDGVDMCHHNEFECPVDLWECADVIN